MQFWHVLTSLNIYLECTPSLPFPGTLRPAEVVVRKCSVKKVFLKISQNSQERNLYQSLFLIKFQAWTKDSTTGACIPNPKALLWTDVFWISHIKWYKFYNNKSSVVLASKQTGTLKLVNVKHENWASIPLLTLSALTFLFTFLRYQIIFQWKQSKEKLGNALMTWRKSRGKTKIGKEIIW